MKHRNRVLLSAAIVLAVPCFAHGNAPAMANSFDIENGDVHVHAKAAADAVISPEGNLSVAGQAVTVTPTQQALLKHYHTVVVALRDHAYETGMAGAGIAADALVLAATAIAGDDTAKSSRKVDATAEKIKAAATQICSDLADIHITQDSIAQQLPVFRPYATLDSDAVANCHSN